jgi:hypothetical protein
MTKKYVDGILESYSRFLDERKKMLADADAYEVTADVEAIKNAVLSWIGEDEKRKRYPGPRDVIEQCASLLLYILKNKPFKRHDKPDPIGGDGYQDEQINEQIGLAVVLDIMRKQPGVQIQIDHERYRGLVSMLQQAPSFPLAIALLASVAPIG